MFPVVWQECAAAHNFSVEASASRTELIHYFCGVRMPSFIGYIPTPTRIISGFFELFSPGPSDVRMSLGCVTGGASRATGER